MDAEDPDQQDEACGESEDMDQDQRKQFVGLESKSNADSDYEHEEEESLSDPQAALDEAATCNTDDISGTEEESNQQNLQPEALLNFDLHFVQQADGQQIIAETECCPDNSEMNDQQRVDEAELLIEQTDEAALDDENISRAAEPNEEDREVEPEIGEKVAEQVSVDELQEPQIETGQNLGGEPEDQELLLDSEQITESVQDQPEPPFEVDSAQPDPEREHTGGTGPEQDGQKHSESVYEQTRFTENNVHTSTEDGIEAGPGPDYNGIEGGDDGCKVYNDLLQSDINIDPSPHMSNEPHADHENDSSLSPTEGLCGTAFEPDKSIRDARSKDIEKLKVCSHQSTSYGIGSHDIRELSDLSCDDLDNSTTFPDEDLYYHAKKLVAFVLCGSKFDEIQQYVQDHHENMEHICDISVCDWVSPVTVTGHCGRVDILQLFMDTGVNLSVPDAEGCSAIHRAAFQEQTESVQLLAEQGQCYLETKTGCTALHIAASAGNTDMVKTLLLYMDDMNTVNHDGWIPLHVAAQIGATDIAVLLILHGADINLKCAGGDSSLHLAAENGHCDMLEALVNFGADVNSKNDNGLTVLHLALQGNLVDGVKLLLPHVDLNLHMRLPNGHTMIHQAIESGSLDCIEVLHTYASMNLNVRNSNGTCALSFAVKNANAEAVEKLLSYGASANVTDVGGMTPLHWSCQSGYLSIANILLAQGVDINSQSACGGSTPLFLACKAGRPNIVQRLLESDADVHCARKDGTTPLHIACTYNHASIVALLLDYGADSYMNNDEGYSALSYVLKHNKVDILKLLIQNNMECMYSLATAQCLRELKLLRNTKDFNINCTNNKSQTALFLAVQDGHMAAVKSLLSVGADVNIRDMEGNTCLHIAAKLNHAAIADCILKKGVDCTVQRNQQHAFLIKAGKAGINMPNNDKNTALHVAVHCGHVEVAHVLLRAGAHCQMPGQGDQQPLYMACGQSNLDMVALLLSAGANPNEQNEEGKTSLFAAIENGQDAVLDMLLANGGNPAIRKFDGTSVLHKVAAMGQAENLLKLQQHFPNVSVNVKTDAGMTPLHLAARSGHLNVVLELVMAGADVNLKNQWGSQAIHEAANKGHLAIIEVLLDAGAKVMLLNEEGRAVYELARHKEIWELLKQWSTHHPYMLEQPSPASAGAEQSSESASSSWLVGRNQSVRGSQEVNRSSRRQSRRVHFETGS